ncbi:MAG TPA: TonB-dependent siderophore receptor [Methylibium sp.]|uniref:TonB-dependent siderophore receptor n=1 Tax=Methylibium sp. TaxID=2067992 RepID=UPI002DBCC5A7|nr:TonB-dependent siderophore receptor [Methylibium sp.]HEU4460553.1 TonB-dependent siderophore receptor [Methylibium sp.]
MRSTARRAIPSRLHSIACACVCLGAAGGTAQAQQGGAAPPDAAASASEPAARLPAITVTGRRAGEAEAYGAGASSTATRLELKLRETPQSISVVPRALIDDFVLNDVNDLLASVTGVSVERVEPDRTYFSVRGFEVSNFQIDGVGLPFATGDQIGNLDTAPYERVEVLRGANGLLSSTGNPSATVNFVRKRPSRELKASAALGFGSWGRRRVDADVGGALDAGGSVRGRLSAAAQDGDSYLDRYALSKRLVAGIVEVDLAPGSMLALGHARQHNRPTGVMWGTLPLYDSSGAPTRYPTEASSAPPWSFWNSDDTQTFAELSQRLGAGWEAKAVLTHRELKSDAELFFVTGQPDALTRDGLASFPSKYGSKETQKIVDLQLAGPFTLAGRRHRLVLGVNAGRSDNALRSSNDDGGLPLSEAEMLAGSFPRPAFDQGVTGQADFSNRRSSLYGVARFELADALHLMTGANLTRATSRGTSYGVAHDYAETKLTPYAGVTWDLDAHHTLYGSYGAIFNPQTQIDAAGNVLAPIEGSNAELGVKGEWMDGRLNGSFALFRVRQDNTAEALPFDAALGRTAYRGIDATATGFELDVAGTPAPGWQLGGGYTQMRIEDPDGAATRTYVPRRTLRLTTSLRLPFVEALKLGASLRWQSRIERRDGAVVTRQGAYGLLDLVATYDFSRRWSLSAKIENATDKRHLNSLMWPDQAFYGAPRSGWLSLRWTY